MITLEGIDVYYSRPYDSLRVEKGFYSSYSGEIDFHGTREGSKGKTTEEGLRQAIERGDNQYSFGRLSFSKDGMVRLLAWLEEEKLPEGFAGLRAHLREDA